MSRNENSNGNSTKWLVLSAIVVPFIFGISYFAVTSGDGNNESAQQELVAQLESLDPESRRYASNYLELSEAYNGIAENASRLNRDNARQGTAEIVSQINEAVQLKNAAEALPQLSSEASARLNCYSTRCQLEHSRMFRELYAASNRLGGQESYQLRSVAQSFSSETSVNSVGVASSFME